MSQAKITKPEGYRCAPRGAVIEHFAAGSIVTGQVAEWALADHAAQRMFDPREETKVVAPSETKKRGRPRKNGGEQ